MSNIIKANELEQLLAPKKSDFIALLNGKPEIFTREISFAVQAINGSEMLQKCDRNSVLQAVYNIALTGLSLNPIAKLAYLTPRWNGKKQGWINWINKEPFTPDRLRERVRYRPVVSARFIMFDYLQKIGWTLSAIARHYNLSDHTTVMNGLSVLHDFVYSKYDSDLKSCYKSFNDILNKKQHRLN